MFCRTNSNAHSNGFDGKWSFVCTDAMTYVTQKYAQVHSLQRLSIIDR